MLLFELNLSLIFKIKYFFFIIFDDGAGGDNEVQRTMLEIVNQLNGF